MNEQPQLFSYWRSSAAYRVRIALNLKGIAFETVPVHLVHGGGEQHAPAYAALNPQELVPTLCHKGEVIRQSLAIIEYLEDTWPAPALLPADAAGRARVRGLAQLVACDIHPLNNLRVQRYLEKPCQVTPLQREEWTRHWIRLGFEALELILRNDAATGDFCHGDAPSLADCCLVPQVYNARRFRVDMAAYPAIAAVERHCLALSAFDAARPESQPDAPSPA